MTRALIENKNNFELDKLNMPDGTKKKFIDLVKRQKD
jgi:hypothetical protein